MEGHIDMEQKGQEAMGCYAHYQRILLGTGVT